MYCALRLLSHSFHWHKTMHSLYIASGVQDWVVCQMEEIAQRIKSLEKGVSRGLSVLGNRNQPADSLPAEQSDAVWLEDKWGQEDTQVMLVVAPRPGDNGNFLKVYEDVRNERGELSLKGTSLSPYILFKRCFPLIKNATEAARAAVSKLDPGTEFGPFTIGELEDMTMEMYCDAIGIKDEEKADLIAAEAGIKPEDIGTKEEVEKKKKRRKKFKETKKRKNERNKRENECNKKIQDILAIVEKDPAVKLTPPQKWKLMCDIISHLNS